LIHQISLAECLEQYAPPAKVLNVSTVADTVFVRICDVDQNSDSETHREVADISVSLPALIEALNLLAVDGEREDLRPLDNTGQAHETKFAGRRLTITPVAPWSAVAALTDHYRETPEPKPGKSARESVPAQTQQQPRGEAS
jgi:hypothetical protein